MAWSTQPDRYRGISPRTANRIRRRDNKMCRTCGRPGNDVDHIVNVKAGGTDHDDNLQVLCGRCHQSKTQAEARAARAAWSKAHPRLRPAEDHPGLL